MAVRRGNSEQPPWQEETRARSRLEIPPRARTTNCRREYAAQPAQTAERAKDEMRRLSPGSQWLPPGVHRAAEHPASRPFRVASSRSSGTQNGVRRPQPVETRAAECPVSAAT